MNTLKYFLFALIAAAAVSAYFLNDSVRQFTDQYILSAPQEHSTDTVPQSHIFVLADGTGSNHSQFNIDKLDTGWMHSLILNVFKNGGGKVWISYIDQNPQNNPSPLSISVPSQPVLGPFPTLRPGEARTSLSKRQNNWEEKRKTFAADSLRIVREFSSELEDFMNETANILNSRVYTQHPENNHTDLVGCINVAIDKLNTWQNSHTRNYIVAFSDLVHDPHPSTAEDTLKPVPGHFEIIAVNSVPDVAYEPLKTYRPRPSLNGSEALDVLFH